MKRKLMITVMVVAMTAGSFGVSFADTRGNEAVKSYFAELYKIFNFIINGSGDIPENDKDESTEADKLPSDSTNYTQAERILNLVNKERKAESLSELSLNSSLNNIAQLKAEDMAENKYFSHNSPTYGSAFDMMKKYGIHYRTAGENIAKGQKTAESVMTGWMNSQGHRANILKKEYTELGVGYAVDKNGTPYWVQMFIG